MTRLRSTGTIAASFGLIIAVGLAGCSRLNVESDPDTFPVPLSSASGLRGGQKIAVENFYKGPTVVPVAETGAGVDADLHQYTQTAMTQLRRTLRAQGIPIGPSPKTVTLKVANVSFEYGWTITYRLSLTAALEGAGTVTVTAANSSPATAYRAIDGAIMRAVTKLLINTEFEKYINE